MSDTKTKNKSKNTGAKAFVKYMGMASQMAIILIVFVLIGKKGDEYFANETPYLTLLAVIVGTFAAFYLTLKDLIKR